MALGKKIKEQNNHAPYLTEELLINILVRLPAKVLVKSMRLVCKHWASIIRDPLFVEAHLRQSSTGLFIYNKCSPCPAHFLEIEGVELKVTDLRWQFPGRMLASCDGVSLFNNSYDHRAFWVANPVTLQAVMLPYLDVPPKPLYYSTCIARVPSSGKYKVVHSYRVLNKLFHWLVVTVGIDNSWRKIDYQQSFGSDHVDLDCFAVSVGGVIYWPEYDFHLDGINYFLAMDMADETIYDIPIPSGCNEPCAYLSMGNYLSGFRTNMSTMRVEVCFLKDFHRGEWSKICEIDMIISGGMPQGPFLFFPIGWLNNGAVVILEALTSQGEIYFAYDVKKKETRIVDLSICGRDFSTLVHTDSLVYW